MSLKTLGFVQKKKKSDSHKEKTNKPFDSQKDGTIHSLALGCVWRRRAPRGWAMAGDTQGGSQAPFPAHRGHAGSTGDRDSPPRAQGPVQGQSQHGLALLGFAQALLSGEWGQESPGALSPAGTWLVLLRGHQGRDNCPRGAAAQWRGNSWVSEHLRLLKCSAGYMVFAVDCKLLRTDSLPLFFIFLVF